VATIILADVQGSTDLLEKVGTERWVDIMNHLFQLLEAEIYRYDGRVDQFRGDGLVAFFGTTVAHEDDPERGVLAAMAMQRALRPYASDLREREEIELSLRVGVNTGEVIVTSVGDERTYSEDTAMGEAIALAARMEQAADPGSVLVSENTYRLTGNQFDWEPLGEIMVKGISQPVRVYRPLAPQTAADRSQDYDLAIPLIGRSEELQILIEVIEDLYEGRGGIVKLTGERGMGKSFLLFELRRHFARQQALLAEVRTGDESQEIALTHQIPGDPGPTDGTPPPRWRELRGRARSYDQTQPYAMWQDLLRNWLGIRKDESKEKTSSRLQQQAEALWGDEMADYYPDLATFLGLPLAPAFAEQVKHLDADGLRQQFFLTIRSWIEQLAHEGPLIITFSDMHWADTTSLDLLKYCLPLCDYLDLLWLCVFRPDRRSTVWEFSHHVETEYPHRQLSLSLSPLDIEESLEMIHRMVGEDALPAETEYLIADKAEGNPLFIQELIRSLIDNGILVRETIPNDGEEESAVSWHATQAVTSLSLPDSLQGLLMARIDRLTPTEQLLLQRAAVIGPVFWSKVLRAICTDLDNLKTHLTALQRTQLIAERGRVPDLGVEYYFKSNLVRDAAYDSILVSQRRTYHLAIAEYLERQLEIEPPLQDQGLYLSALVTHYHEAQKRVKELEYTLKNAERSKEIYANAEASQHYTRALALLEQLEEEAKDPKRRYAFKTQRFQILMGRHKVYHLMAEFDKMRFDAERLLPLARELSDDPAWLIDALLHQPGVGDYQNRDEVEGGMELAQEALTLSQQLGDKRRELESLIAIANQQLTFSDPAWHQQAERALALAQEIGDKQYEARLLVGMGGIFAFSDQPEQSMEYLEAAAALAMSEGLEDKVIQMSLLNLLGLEFERNGDYYRLLTEYQQERLHASREIGHRPMESQALGACGRIMGIYLGDYTSGLSLLEECRRILRGTRDEVHPLFHVAQIQVAQADHTGAQETLEQIQLIGEPIKDRAQASFKLVCAMLHNARGTRAATRGNASEITEHLEATLRCVQAVIDSVEQSPLVSLQYEMAAQCQATLAYMGLAQSANEEQEHYDYLDAALRAAERAHEIFQHFGFVQIVECVSEEVMFRYSQALAANQQQDLAVRYLRRAYDEMIRKQSLIPAESHFRRTYLQQIPLHREIRAAYASRVGSILAEANQLWYQTEMTT
jgi:predicted ATPase/class 3 adenylate cyclase